MKKGKKKIRRIQKMSNFREIYDYLNKLLSEMAVAKKLPSLSRLTTKVHVWPDFHGNRSPIADPSILGMVLKIY